MTDRARHLFYLVVFPVGHFSVDTPSGALWLLAPAIGLAWDLSPAEVGFIITAHSLGGGLGAAPAGLFGDWFRRRGVLLLTTLWWVVLGYLAASVAPGYGVLVALLGLAGIGGAAWHPIAMATMVQHMSHRRAQALGAHQTGGVAADAIAPLAVGVLLNFMDWRAVLQISVIPAALMGASFLYLSRHVRPLGESRISWADLRLLWVVWRTPSGLRMFLLAVSYNVSFVALLAMTPLFFRDYHGYSSAWVGSLFAVMLLGGGLAAPILGRLSDEIGRKPVATLSMGIAAGGAVLTAFAPSTVPLIVGAVIAASLLAGVRPVLLAAAVEVAGRREATSLGLIFAVMDGVGALGGLLAGLAGGADLRYALVFAAVTAAAATGVSAVHTFGDHQAPRPAIL